MSCIWIDIDNGIHVNLEFLIELYLIRQIPENTMSCILIDIDNGIHVNLEFLIELYLTRQIPENTD